MSSRWLILDCLRTPMQRATFDRNRLLVSSYLWSGWLMGVWLIDGIFSEKTDVVSSRPYYPTVVRFICRPQFAWLYNWNCWLRNWHFMQWSFGVTCWEIFSTAKTPYPGIHPTSLIAQLENGERLLKPNNAACCDAMVNCTFCSEHDICL